MPDVDENMDELFRQAADNYMLREDDSNWDEISARLKPAATPLYAVKKNRAKRYILMAMLMLMFFIAGDLFHTYTSNRETANSKIQETEKNSHVNNDEKTTLIEESNKQNPIEKYNSTNENASAIAYSKAKKNIENVKQEQSNRITANNKNKIDLYLKNSEIDYRQTTALLINGIRENIDTTVNSNLNNFSNHAMVTTKTFHDSIMADDILANTSSLKDSVSAGNPVAKIKIEKQSGLYVGLLAGATFNSVKQQDISKPGLDIGLITGYQINTSLSVETGIRYSRKNYYTVGKYFNMDKVGNSMPRGMQVVSLDGSSSVIEFPVIVKYNFIQKNHNAIYGSAGLSSYLLTNEKNNYTTLLNSTTGSLKTIYKQNATYLAGAINLSAGYQHQFGAKSYVRFEPYIEIPTKGIGVGKLPVASSGIHVLFTIAPH